MNTARRILILFGVGILTLTPVVPVLAAGAPPTPPPVGPPGAGRPAPSFVLPDTAGKKRSLAEFRGRPAALFFFCGCSWCSDVAREWARLQRSGSFGKPSTSRSKVPITLVVYQGSAEEVRTLSTTAGLDPAQTVLLPDPEMTVTMEIYKADPCPRVFVVDAQGIIRYVNNGKDDAPREAPAMVIVSRTVDALRSAAGPEASRKNKREQKTVPSKGPAR